MDQELKLYLDGRFDEVRGEIAEVRAEIAEVRAEIEKTETKLLSAFHGWARPMEIRQRGTSITVAGFDERLVLAEERISELERARSK